MAEEGDEGDEVRLGIICLSASGDDAKGWMGCSHLLLGRAHNLLVQLRGLRVDLAQLQLHGVVVGELKGARRGGADVRGARRGEGKEKR